MNTDRHEKPTRLKLLYVIALVCVLAIDCPSGLAGEKVSGRALFLVTPPTTIPVGASDDGHVLRYAAERGTQMEYAGTDWLKGCALMRTSTCDLVHERGACFGYQIWLAPNGDQLVAKYSGVVLPDQGSDKKPQDTIFRGTWVYVKGTGIFSDLAGAGIYRGRYTSASEYDLEWSGEIDRRVAPTQR